MYPHSALLFLLLCSTGYSAKTLSVGKLGKALNLTTNTTTPPTGIDNIIGGNYAASGQFPYQVSIQINSSNTWQHFCGGSVYTTRYIITAAHCLYGSNNQRLSANILSIYAGSIYLYTGGTRYLVSKTIPNSAYNSATITNDIGLIQTSTDITFSNAIKPVNISSSVVGIGVSVTVSGWGKTGVFSGVSNTLKYLNTMTGFCILPPSQMCTFNYFLQGTCNGDSGGPLVRTGTYNLVGIVSYGFSGCIPPNPSYFTRVSYFYSWIKSNAV